MTLNESSDFREGNKVSPSKIKEWHTQVIDMLLKGSKNACIRSGNSMVFGQLSNPEDRDEPIITIYEIMDGYKEYSYENIFDTEKTNQ